MRVNQGKLSATYPAEYKSWVNMKCRCRNPKHRNFAEYGGRGIGVCDRWLVSFANFLADMGPKPSRQHSLDRMDNNGNYDPSNCRWATKAEQSLNKRSSYRDGLAESGITPQRAYQLRRKARGECIACGRKRNLSTYLCDSCYAKRCKRDHMKNPTSLLKKKMLVGHNHL